MIDLKKNKPYAFSKHLLNSAMALVLVLLPMYWFDFISFEGVILILGITIAYYPMHRRIVMDRRIAETKQC